jgi:hypothetical protein
LSAPISFPKERRLRNLELNPINPILKGANHFQAGLWSVPLDLTSRWVFPQLPVGYGGKESMGENWDMVSRVDRHGQGSGSEKEDREVWR